MTTTSLAAISYYYIFKQAFNCMLLTHCNCIASCCSLCSAASSSVSASKSSSLRSSKRRANKAPSSESSSSGAWPHCGFSSESDSLSDSDSLPEGAAAAAGGGRLRFFSFGAAAFLGGSSPADRMALIIRVALMI